MKNTTLLKHYDTALNTFYLGTPAFTRKILKGLRRDAKTVDLGGYNDHITERLDDILGLISDVIQKPGANISKTQVRQFEEDLIDQIRIIYLSTGCSYFDCSNLLLRSMNSW